MRDGLDGLFAAADGDFVGVLANQYNPFSAQLQLRPGAKGWVAQ